MFLMGMSTPIILHFHKKAAQRNPKGLLKKRREKKAISTHQPPILAKCPFETKLLFKPSSPSKKGKHIKEPAHGGKRCDFTQKARSIPARDNTIRENCA